MSDGKGGEAKDGLEPDLEQARQTANLAHGVVIKLKGMGLPPALDGDLASLSTDLGDLWSAQKALTDRLQGFLGSPDGWEASGDRLVDLRASIDHIAWHVNSVRRPLSKIARFAYRKALEQRSVRSDSQ